MCYVYVTKVLSFNYSETFLEDAAYLKQAVWDLPSEK